MYKTVHPEQWVRKQLLCSGSLCTAYCWSNLVEMFSSGNYEHCKCAKAVGMIQAGTSIRQVARHFSIQSLCAKYVHTESVEDLRQLPKRRLTTPLQDIQIVNVHLHDLFTVAATTARTYYSGQTQPSNPSTDSAQQSEGRWLAVVPCGFRFLPHDTGSHDEYGPGDLQGRAGPMFYLLTKHALHNAGVTYVLAHIAIGVSGTTRTVWYNGITLGWFHHVVDWGFHARENPNCTHSRKHERDKVST